jgi:phosphonopyruvate decarboxylase
MIDQDKLLSTLQNSGVEFIAGVPDTVLNDFCLNVMKKWQQDRHIIAANEGNAMALAAGYHLSTGSVPMVYMQNSGLGNVVNPLLSLTHTDVYSIPVVLLIGWRGDPAMKDHTQHKKQGEITPALLDIMDVPFKILEHDTEDVLNKVRWAVQTAKETNCAVALVARKGILAKCEKEGFNEGETLLMSREEAIKCVIESVPNNSIFVASTGRATRELYELRNLRNQGHESDFLNVGAMGHTSSIALGLTLGLNNRLVVCLEGDSSAIMHLGAFTTTGQVKPDNFLHILLNNGVHESVGGQPSAGFSADLTSIAEKSGYNTIGGAVKTAEKLQDSIKILLNKKGPCFIEVIIKKGIRSDLPPLRFDFQISKQNFMQNVSRSVKTSKDAPDATPKNIKPKNTRNGELSNSLILNELNVKV